MSVLVIVEAKMITLQIVVSTEGYKLSIVKPKAQECPIKAPDAILSFKELAYVDYLYEFLYIHIYR